MLPPRLDTLRRSGRPVHLLDGRRFPPGAIPHRAGSERDSRVSTRTLSNTNRALQNGFDALLTTAAELIDNLSASSREGRMRDTLVEYLRPHVLVVDEVGYLSYGDDAANVLYHVVNDRHIRRRSMVFTTNNHPKRWGSALHDEDLAEAIVDRILERGRYSALTDPPSGQNISPATSSPATTEATQPAAEFPERAAQSFRNAQHRSPLRAGRPPKAC